MELSPALSYQVIGYVEYNLEFAGLNAMHGEDRRNQTALETAFKFSTNLDSYQNSACRPCQNKNKNIAPPYCKNSELEFSKSFLVEYL